MKYLNYCILIGTLTLYGCSSTQPEVTDQDSDHTVQHVCLKPENKDTVLCQKRL